MQPANPTKSAAKRPLPTRLLSAMALVLPIGLAQADPPVTPPEPQLILPRVFCFRITDIQRVPGDPEEDAFELQFEALNWTASTATGLDIALNNVTGWFGTGDNAPFFNGAGVDPDGRPFGGDDDANFPPADNTSGTKTGIINDWSVGTNTNSHITWAAGTGLSFRDLLNAATTQDACDLVPGCTVTGNFPQVANPETVDNAAPGVDGGVDNVRDGFTITIDDFDPGETISFNWNLLGAGGPIGAAGMGNQFGFGTFTVARKNGGFETGFTPLIRDPNSAEGPGASRGLGFGKQDFFVYETSQGDQFAGEFGAGTTASFWNPSDNVNDLTPNAQIIPPPWSIHNGHVVLDTVVVFDPENEKGFINFPDQTTAHITFTQPSPTGPNAGDNFNYVDLEFLDQGGGTATPPRVMGSVEKKGHLGVSGNGTVAGRSGVSVFAGGFNFDPPVTPPITGFPNDDFGAIFSDGFESGDTSAWSNSLHIAMLYQTGIPGQCCPEGTIYAMAGSSPDPETTLNASVLPTSRAGQPNSGPISALAVIANAGTETAENCSIIPSGNVFGVFSYQTTDSATNTPTGTADTPVDIPAGGLQTFVFSFTPLQDFAPNPGSTTAKLFFDCHNTIPAAIVDGLNTLELTQSVTDVIALAATTTGLGIVDLINGAGAFSVATANVGATGTVTFSANAGNSGLDLSLNVCETDADGACISAPAASVTTTINGGDTNTFGVFVGASGNVPFDPAMNRVNFVGFDANGNRVGSTSVAVRDAP